MAGKKPKTKEVPFGNTATETSPGVWEFEIRPTRWRWMNRLGLNCGIVIDDVWYPVVYVKTIDAAALFAEGFTAGQATPRQAKRKEEEE